MFESMEISENIYEYIVEPSYKTNRLDGKRAGHRRKMREIYSLSKSFSEMSIRAGKLKKRHVDHPRDRSKLTCLIQGIFHFSYN